MNKPQKLKSYNCKIEDFFKDGTNLESNIIAKSASKARYFFWQLHNDSLVDYCDCFRAIKVKTLGTVKPEHYFFQESSEKDFIKMCKYRNIEFAKPGMVVNVSGNNGWIVGSNSSMNLEVLFEDYVTTSNCHPNYGIAYYDNNGNLIKSFGKR